MYQLPQKLRALTPYEPNTGVYTVRVDANESFLEPPEELRRQIAQAVSALPFNRYPDPCCTVLRQSFGRYFGVDPSLVVAGNGSDELIGLIFSGFTGPDDTVVTVSPDFSMYDFYAQFNGARVVRLDKSPDQLALDPDRLIQLARKEKAGVVIFSNPCNPTSLTASAEDIRRIVEALEDCLVVVDEAYMEFSSGSVLSLAAQTNNLIVLKTFSKAFGMAGIRLGFAVASPQIARALDAARSPYNVNAMTQAVGTLLLRQKAYLEECSRTICRSRDDLYHAIEALAKKYPRQLSGVVNTTANFVFLRPSDAEELFRWFGDRGIAVRKLGDHLRISAGSPSDNAAVLEMLEEYLKGKEPQA